MRITTQHDATWAQPGRVLLVGGPSAMASRAVGKRAAFSPGPFPSRQNPCSLPGPVAHLGDGGSRLTSPTSRTSSPSNVDRGRIGDAGPTTTRRLRSALETALEMTPGSPGPDRGQLSRFTPRSPRSGPYACVRPLGRVSGGAGAPFDLANTRPGPPTDSSQDASRS